MRKSTRRGACAVTAVVMGSLLVWAVPPATAAPPASGTRELAQRLGLQLVPKSGPAQRKAAGPAAANPILGLLPDPSQADMHQWRARIEQRSKARTSEVDRRRRADGKLAAPLLVDEQEPDAIRGGNDTAANAQRITRFGTAGGKRPAARILGTYAAPPPATALAPSTEDDGSITLARNTGLRPGRPARTTGTIGDGPHGSAGDDSGDFDFYAVRGGAAGQRLSVDIDSLGSDLDSVVIVWDAAGNAIAANDDAAVGSLDSLLVVTLPAAGDYFVSVLGFASIPEDPFDSGSGDGADSEGGYAMTLGLDTVDVDYYAVDLRAGDVLSGSISGSGANLAVYGPDRREVFGSTQDASSIYPADSPLTGGGNAVVDHVAASSGRHYVATYGLGGDYSVNLEAYRPGPDARNVTQTIFLDFDGQRINTGIFGGRGVTQLSPLSAFLGRWGIPASQQNALINRVVTTVTENLREDFSGTGVRVRILNSRDHADPFGRADVSRLIVGGTIEESGVATIGIAQSIDPGNFDTTESALILLDVLSDPGDAEDAPASLNTYLTPASNRVRFVGTALGNVASHEAGHYLGNWHVDQFNPVLNLMDQGGNFPLLYGVGPDGVGGTADDPDVDFGRDTLNPNEGFSGLENTRARTRWGLTR